MAYTVFSFVSVLVVIGISVLIAYLIAHFREPKIKYWIMFAVAMLFIMVITVIRARFMDSYGGYGAYGDDLTIDVNPKSYAQGYGGQYDADYRED